MRGAVVSSGASHLFFGPCLALAMTNEQVDYNV
jgi:hypothetical protein